MNKYEVMFLLEPREEEAKQAMADIRGFVTEQSGKLTKEDDMGIRRPAYKIKKRDRVHYYLIQAEMESERIVKMDDFVRVNDNILKFQAVRIGDD